MCAVRPCLDREENDLRCRRCLDKPGEDDGKWRKLWGSSVWSYFCLTGSPNPRRPGSAVAAATGRAGVEEPPASLAGAGGGGSEGGDESGGGGGAV